MLESVKKAMAREQTARANAQQFEPPTISTIDDIRRALQLLDPQSRLNERLDDVHLQTSIQGSDGRKSSIFGVETTSSSRSYRDILLEGFKIVHQREKAAVEADDSIHVAPVVVDDVPMIPPRAIAVDARMGMDAIIERLLGGYRDGVYVCWDLDDGYTYRYEIFQHRLTRIEYDA